MSAGPFVWSHIVQVPLVLLVNGFLAWLYYTRAAEKPGDSLRHGPLALHCLGTALVLVQPVFDSPGGILSDLRTGFDGHLNAEPGQRVEPPAFMDGGFWHHGLFMALVQVAGLLCVVSANLWSSGVLEGKEPIREAGDGTAYGTQGGKV